MSRSIVFFDYAIPEALRVTRGSFVEIPLRSHTVMGVVKRVKDHPARGIQLKTILTVLPDLSLTENELTFFEELAKTIVQPTANLLYTSLPHPSRRRQPVSSLDWRSLPLTIPSQESPTVSRLAKQMTERRRAFVQTPDLRRTAAVLAHYLNQRPEEKRMIVCPHVHDVRVLVRALSAYQPLCFTGEESQTERFAVWQHYRNARSTLLITTQAGMLLADQKTTGLFLVRSGHPDHVQHQRNPRLDARTVLTQFSEQFTTNLFFFDVCPRVEDLEFFGEEHLLAYPINTPITYVNPAKERPTSQHVAITTTCAEVIAQTVEHQGRVLLIYNKKGYGIRLRCQDCPYRFVCTRCGHLVGADEQTISCTRCGHVESIPLRCPTCRSTNIRVRGFGSRRLAETLQKWFPNTSLEIIDKEHPQQNGATITLATRFYLEQLFDPMRPDAFTNIIHLDPDTPLFSPTFRSTERAIWSAFEWRGIAHATGALFYMQTEEEELFDVSFQNISAYLDDERDTRRSYEQPPFSVWITVRLKEEERKKRELEQHLLKEALERLQNVRVKSIASDQPGRNEMQICFPQTQRAAVLKIFVGLDDRYVIDTNAFS